MKSFLKLLLVFSILLTFVIVLSIVTNAATSGTCGDNLTWTLDDDGTLTISGTGEMTLSYVPWCDSLVKKIVIEDGVTTIADYAFRDCNNSNSVTIPSSIVSIGDNAFCTLGVCECVNLSAVYISDLAACCNISFDNGGSNPLNCAKNLYLDNNLLTEVAIPDGVTLISNYAFLGYDKLTSVTIPNSVTTIGYSAFAGCVKLTSVTIPDSVTEIGYSAFYKCNNLTSVTLPECLNSIKDDAFKDCTSLVSVIIPNSVTTIGWGAFEGCNNLTSVTIRDGVNTIGPYAFAGCSNLTSVTIPDSVTTIEFGAFEGCTKLEELILPFIGISLTTRNKAETVFGAIFGYTSDKAENMICQKYGKSEEDCAYYYIPSSLRKITITNIETIPDYAFYNCSFLTEINIPSSVNNIGSYAFYNCSNLKNIKIPNSVTKINAGTFGGCESLTGVVLPQNVTSIGAYAFSGCGRLKELIMQKDVKSIGDYAFSRSGLTSVTIPDSIGLIEDCTFNGCINLVEVKIPDSITSIGDSAFRDCGALRTITIPHSVETIGNHAFSASGLTSVTIPNSVRSIEDCAFSWCKSLVQVIIESGVSYIGGSMFDYSSKLKSISIPSSITSIRSSAFYGCNSLSDVWYDDTLEKWNKITIGTRNDCLKNATLHYVFISVSDVMLDKSEITLLVNNSETLIATVVPTDATDKNVIWKSSDTSVATVSNGVVNAIAPGIATITVETEDGGKRDTCILTVVEPIVSVINISLNKTSAVLILDDTETLIATVSPSNATNKNVIWTSSDRSVVTVSNGVITAVGVGTATITVTTVDGGYTASCTVIVEDKNAYLSGDINGDGVVGAKDVTVLRRYIAGGYDVTVVAEALDVNGDGEITTKDVTVLRRFIAGGYGVELE